MRSDRAGVDCSEFASRVSLYGCGLAKRRRGKIDEHDKQMALLIQRGNNRLFVPVTLG